MGLKILKNVDGSFRRVWYGRLTRNGRKVDVKLDAGPIEGTIPETAGGQWDKTAKGDKAFEASRREAEAAFRAVVKGDGKRRKTLEGLERERRILTGKGFGRTALSTLFAKWCGIKREKEPTEIRRSIARATFASFATFADTFARKNGTTCSSLEDVSVEMAGAYFEKLKASYSWETAKGRYSLLKSAWKRFSRANGEPNPFDGVIVRGGSHGEAAKISRVPLTLAQLGRLFEIVREKRPTLFPLLACAATTGLRLGDAAALKWDDVALERRPAEIRAGRHGTIGLRSGLETSKTGARVVLPILEPFASVLRELDGKRDERDVYVFPEAFARYTKPSTRSGLVREIKPFFALAVSEDAEPEEEAEEVREPKTLAEVLALIDDAGFAPGKAERLRKVAEERFAGPGFTGERIAADLGIGPAQVSADLRTLEELTGDVYRTGGRRGGELGRTRLDLIKATRKGHGKGRNAASIYGWHSLRASFVVLAVDAGVPLAYVEKAVGHTTAQMTLQYFNPTGLHAAKVIGTRLGSALALEEPAPEPVRELTAKEAFEALPADERKKLARLALEAAGMI